MAIEIIGELVETECSYGSKLTRWGLLSGDKEKTIILPWKIQKVIPLILWPNSKSLIVYKIILSTPIWSTMTM